MEAITPMGLSFYYEFSAEADTTAATLESFLLAVEKEAKALGFAPTTVLNVPFDTPDRREFSRRLGGRILVQDERLKGLSLPDPESLSDHDPVAGEGRLIPKRGVVLVVTDERGCESCFGFFRFPDLVLDVNGKIVATSPCVGGWLFRDFVDSPDERYREIVNLFRKGGYMKSCKDEFA